MHCNRYSTVSTEDLLLQCITPVYRCDGWEVTTVEGLGSKSGGSMHPIQSSLAAFNGTQCGFCSPGMVMAMNSLYERTGGAPTMEAVEAALDGNLCRCTGYRPILDAFKSFSPDAPAKLRKKREKVSKLIFIFKKKGCHFGQLSAKFLTFGRIYIIERITSSKTWPNKKRQIRNPLKSVSGRT